MIHWRRDRLPTPVFLGFTDGSAGKDTSCNVGDLGLIRGLGRSPGEGNGYPLQYSSLEDSMDCIVHGVTKSQTQLRDFHFHCFPQLPSHNFLFLFSSVSVQSLSRARLCDLMNCSTPVLPVYHQLPEFTQTHVRRVGDAIQPSHPLLSPFPPALSPSQHQGLFQWVNFSHVVAQVLEFQL